MKVSEKRECAELGLPLELVLAEVAPEGFYVHGWSTTHAFYRRYKKTKRCPYCGCSPCSCED